MTRTHEAGALAADHGTEVPYTERLGEHEVADIFDWALRGQASDDDAACFTGHMWSGETCLSRRMNKQYDSLKR